MRIPRNGRIGAMCLLLMSAVVLVAPVLVASAAPPPTLSYHRDVRRIIQAKCQMCHQPASAGGGLVVTTFALFNKGGEHGRVFVVGKPEASPVLDYLTGKRSLMPKGGPPLSEEQIAVL